MTTFKQFLAVKCMEDTQVMDDDLPDVYPYWIAAQSTEAIIAWAEEWRKG